MTPIVHAQHIDFSFGEGELRKQVLDQLDFHIDPGEIVIMTGPSGSGKTTLLTLIGGLRTLRQGSLRVLGQEMREATAAEQVAVRRRTGFIFQQHNLLGFLTARQNVLMSFELNPIFTAAERNERADQVLDRVGLADRRHYYPGKLSGGQKQRVAIARALAGNPELVLADEPTAALDSVSGREAVNLLQQLAREQRCPILLVTHDSRVLDVADRIVHMEDGRIQSDQRAKAALGGPA